jgi:thioredoxin 1
MSTATALTSQTFDEATKSATPMLVDFWAEWCGPCRALSPILDDLAADLAGRLTITKLNVDDNPDIAERFQVLSIPTVILFHKGEVKARVTGLKSKEALKSLLDPHLV